MKLVTIDENSKWLSAVQKLGDDSRLTLGFMPAQAFVDYAKRKQILGLIINGELVAYTMFRYKKTSLIIVHFCVSTKHRSHGYAKNLMSALYQQEKDYVSQFMLSCRRDYNLDKFWYSLSNLDARLRMEMRSEIRRIQQESKVTTIFVTHDQEEAMSITDEIVLMRQGSVQQVAPPHAMYADPVNCFAASFMGNPPISYVDAELRDGWAVLSDGLRLPCGAKAQGKVRIGIRPEAWSIGGDIPVELTSVEMRGQDQVVGFRLSGHEIRAILDAEQEARPGQRLALRLRENRCYCFDPVTETRL